MVDHQRVKYTKVHLILYLCWLSWTLQWCWYVSYWNTCPSEGNTSSSAPLVDFFSALLWNFCPEGAIFRDKDASSMQWLLIFWSVSCDVLCCMCHVLKKMQLLYSRQRPDEDGVSMLRTRVGEKYIKCVNAALAVDGVQMAGRLANLSIHWR